MKTKKDYAQELLMKEERVCAWEEHGVLDGDFCETPKVEYWYIEE
ncbi:MAG: hypothetical protein ACP5NW_04120 [Candidatus Woesearchaeota archaeon]